MEIWLNTIYFLAILTAGLVVFLWLASKHFNGAIYLTIFLLPLYIFKFRIWFVPFNVQEALVWILFAVWLLQKKYRKIDLLKIKNFILPALFVLIGTVLGVMVSDNLNVSAGILKGWFLAPMVLGLIMTTEIKGKTEIKKALGALFASAGIVGAVGIIYLVYGRLTFDGRLSAFYLSPNQLAMYLVPGFLIGVGLLTFIPGKKAKIIISCGLAIIGVAIYFTFSYAAWLGMLLALVIIFAFGSKNKKLLIFCFLSVIFLLSILFLSQNGTEKLNNLFYSSRSSLQSRLAIWQAAWQTGKAHPVFGIGAGMFQDFYLKYQSHFALPYLEWAVPQPHNIFLAFWLEAGTVGLAGFLWLLIVFFKMIFGAIKQKNQLALVLGALIVYVLLHGLVDTTYWKNDLAMIFWVIIALGTALENYDF